MGHAHDHAHNHAHDHGHDHAHGHGHSHAPPSFGTAFAIGVALNTAFVGVEVVYGLWANSTALLADAGHNLSDVLSLLIAWGAAIAARRPSTRRFTYGLKSSTILAALVNATLLIAAMSFILVETMGRLLHPVEPRAMTMIWVAALGIVINTATALMFMRGRKHDINIRGAFLHMAADALVSAGVVVAGGVILLTGWAIVDPLVSLAIVAVIGWGTWGLLRDSVRMSLLAVPGHIDEVGVRDFLAGQEGVAAVHDLHIWPMSTTETAITAHLVMPAGHPGDGFLRDLAHGLDHDFGIHHMTVQVEVSREDCSAGC